jgi:hypothetical protein
MLQMAAMPVQLMCSTPFPKNSTTEPSTYTIDRNITMIIIIRTRRRTKLWWFD